MLLLNKLFLRFNYELNKVNFISDFKSNDYKSTIYLFLNKLKNDNRIDSFQERH